MKGQTEPVYVATFRRGEMEKILVALRQRARYCELCPHRCGVDRQRDERGRCRTGREAVVASFGPHFGEERPISGHRGSGTIFFAHCNLFCLFCQNDDISHGGHGRPVSPATLADIMLSLQAQGCHNINLVTPSHVIPPFVEALSLAAADGLRIPLVYNSGGYDSVESLELLAGLVDIYMPDLKFLDPEYARAWTIAPDYPAVAKEAIRAMHRQVGDLQCAADGVAHRGLLVRHLVMPGATADSRAVLRFLAEEISPSTYVNIMSQYRPCGEAYRHRQLNRRPSAEEYRAVIEEARRLGLTRAEAQGAPPVDRPGGIQR
ncbi:MAG: radical SAM protein [Acidobacteria bacterium]|nr:radical SAM protein [Acidobacteriota bacterium]